MVVLNKLERFYRILNLLSIDVALGAVCCALWFAKIFQVELRPQALMVLGFTVWIIYTADHLLDARKTVGMASTKRHRFHQQNFTALIVALMGVALADIICVFFIKKVVFQWGVILSIMMLVYFLVQRYLKYLKEFTIAILFSCGVLLPSLAQTQKQIDLSLSLLVAQFVLTALLNLILFSWFDRQNDLHDKRDSIVTVTGEKGAKRFLEAVFLLNIVLLVGSVIYVPNMIDEVAVLFFMNAILIFIFVRSQYFETSDRFRLIGDAVFLLPIIYFLL